MKTLGILRQAGNIGAALGTLGALAAVACGGQLDPGPDASDTSGANLATVESVCAKVAARGCGRPTSAECESDLEKIEARLGTDCGPEWNAALACFELDPFECKEGGASPVGCAEEMYAVEICSGDGQCSEYVSVAGSGGAGGGPGTGGPDDGGETSGPYGCGLSCVDFDVDCTRSDSGYSCVCSRGAEPGKTFNLNTCDFDKDDLRDICGSDPNPPITPEGEPDGPPDGGTTSPPCSGSGGNGEDGAVECSIECDGTGASCTGYEGEPVECVCDNGVEFSYPSCGQLETEALDRYCR